MWSKLEMGYMMDWQFFGRLVWTAKLPTNVSGLSVWTTREPGLPDKTSPEPGHALSPPRNVLDSRVHSVDVGQSEPIIITPPMQHARWMWYVVCRQGNFFFISLLSNS